MFLSQLSKMTRDSRKRSLDAGSDDPTANPSIPKKAKPCPDVSDAVKLDQDGDAIFVLKNDASGQEESYLVSSKVLGLASPVFRTMFSPQFQEGTQVRNGEVPRINLEEDDPEVMGLILRALHFQSHDIPLLISPKKFASIAMHGDKYDCKRALRGWVRGWYHANTFGNFRCLQSDEIGFVLLALYLLRFWVLPDLVTHATRYLHQDAVSKWEHHETLSLLPESLTGKLPHINARINT